MADEVVDVLVVGAGYSGPIAAGILARRGYRVTLIERAVHPRFAIGESTTPEQNRIHDDLGRRYGVPLLRALADWPRAKAAGVAVPLWPKEMFYYLHNPAEHDGAWQETLDQTRPFAPDYHVLRSALDLQLVRDAVAAGVEFVAPAEVVDLELDDPVRVRLRGPAGESTLRGRLLVDATGGRGLLAARLGLVDDDPADYWLRSRSVFNHYLGVRPLPVPDAAGPAPLHIPRDHATVHHLSHDRWTWVIPFDDGVTSVGVVYRADQVPPAAQQQPATLFADTVAANPALAACLADAAPLRDFVQTPVLQWRARQAVGPNWVLLPPASGFVDPLLSPGGVLAINGVARLCDGVDAVLRNGRPADAALAPMAQAGRAELRLFGQLLSALYAAFADPELFRAVYRVHLYGRTLYDLGYGPTPGGHGQRYPAAFAAEYPPYAELVDRLHRALAPGQAPPAPAEIDEWLADVDELGLTDSAYFNPRVAGRHVPTWRHGRLLARQRRRLGAPAFGGSLAVRPLLLARHAAAPWQPLASRPLALLWRHLRPLLGCADG